MRALLLTIMLSGCCTPTIKLKPVQVPERYLAPCEYPNYQGSGGDWRSEAINVTKYAVKLQTIIEECDARLKAIRQLNEAEND